MTRAKHWTLILTLCLGVTLAAGMPATLSSAQSANEVSESSACCEEGSETKDASAESCCAEGSEAKDTSTESCCSEGNETNEASSSGESCCAEGSESKETSPEDGAGSHASQGPPGRGQGRGHGGGPGMPMRDLMHDARTLVQNHADITRTIDEIPGGVRTRTTSEKDGLTALIRKHVREMYAHYQEGGAVRRHDPLFAELAAVAEHIQMTITDIPGGLEVTSTSEEAEVARLIRMHANKVSDFVKRGMPAMHEHTALPGDYQRPSVATP